MTEKKEITLSLSVEEANVLLEALGNLPFKQVYSLIGKIQQQAARQLQPENGHSEAELPITISEKP